MAEKSGTRRKFENIDELIEKVKKMDEQEIKKTYKLESSEDFFLIEKIYNVFVRKLYRVAESDSNVRRYIPYVGKFAEECIKKSGISSLKEYREQFPSSIERMKEIHFSDKKIDKIFSIPTEDIEEDIRTLNDAYCVLYEEIVGDNIKPYIKLALNKNRIGTKGKIINEMKKIFEGKYNKIVEYLKPLIRNAPSHSGVRFIKNRNKIVYEDRERDKREELTPIELRNYVMELIALNFAFLYVYWKRSETLDRALIEGAKIVKKMAPEWKLVPTKRTDKDNASMGDFLLYMSKFKKKRKLRKIKRNMRKL